MHQVTRLTFLLAAALTVVSCGGGGGSPTSPSSGGTPPTSTIVTITIKGVKGKLSFDPNPATVQAGQLVVFKNVDVVTHRVTLDDRSLETGDIAPGASSQPLAIGAASKPYHCSLHPSMVGSFNDAATPEPPPCTGYCG